jgi:hypothetical protein
MKLPLVRSVLVRARMSVIASQVEPFGKQEKLDLELEQGT